MRGPTYLEDIKVPFDQISLVAEGGGKGRLAFFYKGKEFCYFTVPPLPTAGSMFSIVKVEGTLGVEVQS